MTGAGHLINECAYLSFVSLTEPQTNALEIIVDEARIGNDTHLLQLGAGAFSGVMPIEVDKNSQRFRLYWPEYVIYAVANESDARSDDYEIFEGKLFRRYSRSFFLDFAAKGTFPGKARSGERKHWEIACLNHIIYVISCAEPAIIVS